ncbi:hypothetical protein POTOM_030799 [Populus tomentosa]|uniref:Uncharacterized protein n=1 Tax=Populus tomentosa TaxID=118781 RepID=A0A8X8CR49_POPTO|nr:hypothetical protein POTOM_030799 [Populus tomentosa]
MPVKLILVNWIAGFTRLVLGPVESNQQFYEIKRILDLLHWQLDCIDGVIIFLVPGITRLEVVVLERRTDCGPKRQVAESDDVTRKPPLVSWLHFVSCHCSQSTIGSSPSKSI